MPVRSIECPECNELFFTKEMLETHRKNSHSKRLVVEISNVKIGDIDSELNKKT